MSEHTKEPWSINKTLEMVCDVAGENIKSTPANLRRIVACVNACAGISTSVLELQGVPSLELCKRLEQQRDEERKKHEAAVTINERMLSDNRILAEQRDELLAALELLHGHAQLFLGHYTPHHNVFDSTTAAIAKVKP